MASDVYLAREGEYIKSRSRLSQKLMTIEYSLNHIFTLGQQNVMTDEEIARQEDLVVGAMEHVQELRDLLWEWELKFAGEDPEMGDIEVVKIPVSERRVEEVDRNDV